MPNSASPTPCGMGQKMEETLNQSAACPPCADYFLGLDVQGGKPYKVSLCSVGSGEIMYFSSLDESLLWMDRQMDEWQYPHADTQLRSFDPNEAARRKAEGEARHQAWLNGKQDSRIPKCPDSAKCVPRFPKGAEVFHLQILYRQHSSWQGQIVWMRQRPVKKAHFRSMLELLYLIRSAFPDKEPSAKYGGTN